MARLFSTVITITLLSCNLYSQEIRLQNGNSETQGTIITEITSINFERSGLEIEISFNNYNSCHAGPIDLEFEFYQGGNPQSMVNKVNISTGEIVESFFRNEEQTKQAFASELNLEFVNERKFVQTQDSYNYGRVFSRDRNYEYIFEDYDAIIFHEREHEFQYLIQQQLKDVRIPYGTKAVTTLRLPIKRRGLDSYDVKLVEGSADPYPWSRSWKGGIVDYYHDEAWVNDKVDVTSNLNRNEVRDREEFYQCLRDKKSVWLDYTFGEELKTLYNQMLVDDVNEAGQKAVDENKNLVIFIYNSEAEEYNLSNYKDNPTEHLFFESLLISNALADDVIITSMDFDTAVENNVIDPQRLPNEGWLSSYFMVYHIVALKLENAQATSRQVYPGYMFVETADHEKYRTSLFNYLVRHGFVSM